MVTQALLIHVFRAHRPPFEGVVCMFNGNLCNRGWHSTKVLYSFLSLFMCQLDQVLINGRNHKEVYMNDMYGSFNKLCREYSVLTVRVLRGMLSELLISMALCTWVPARKTFVMHAGPPLLLNGWGASSDETGKIQKGDCS